MRKRGREGVRIKKNNSKSIVRTGVAYKKRGKKRTEKEKE